MTQHDSDSDSPGDFPGDRIAKVLSRAGVASRRDAERMVAKGRVSVNGVVIDSPALNVGPDDRISVDGQEIGPPDPVRIWLYHKPAGLVTTARDEEGRDTIFDHMPEGLPYLMPVGRLDLTSEGLLLLTNDGGIKRRLELPSTAWLRRYRVRVNGEPGESALAAMRAGVTVDGVAYQPMEVTFDRQQGANAWLTVGLREGRNREIRRVMEHLGLKVNRLIRISYGPFQLGDLAVGAVEEVRPRVVRDQLGLEARDQAPASAAPAASRAQLTADAGRAGKVRVLRKRGSKSKGAEELARPAGGRRTPEDRSRPPQAAGKPERARRDDRPARPAPRRDGEGAAKSGRPHRPHERDERTDRRPSRDPDARPAREGRRDDRPGSDSRPAREPYRKGTSAAPHRKGGAQGKGREERFEARPARDEGHRDGPRKPGRGRAPESRSETRGERDRSGPPARKGPPKHGAAPHRKGPRDQGPRGSGPRGPSSRGPGSHGPGSRGPGPRGKKPPSRDE